MELLFFSFFFLDSGRIAVHEFKGACKSFGLQNSNNMNMNVYDDSKRSRTRDSLCRQMFIQLHII